MDRASDHSLIPAWDDEGRLRPMDKLEVHRRGLRHKAVSVFVLSEGAVLLQKRAAGKYHTPGLWTNSCCTHPHWGEDDAACARRRLDEELGTGPLPLDPMAETEYRADVGGGLVEHEVVRIFTAAAPRDLPLAPDPDEVSQTAWVELDSLAAAVRRRPSAYTPWLRIYLDRHLETLRHAARLPEVAPR
jgi:isopentenyl-diphosphate delta-isomerase